MASRYRMTPEMAVKLADARLAEALEDPRLAPQIKEYVSAGFDPTTLFTRAFRMGYGLALHDIEKRILGEEKSRDS